MKKNIVLGKHKLQSDNYCVKHILRISINKISYERTVCNPNWIKSKSMTSFYRFININASIK